LFRKIDNYRCFLIDSPSITLSISRKRKIKIRQKKKEYFKKNKNGKKIYKCVVAPWRNFCRQARDKHPVYLYTYHRFVYASKRDCVFSTRFSRIRSFVYVCMFREYTCMSVCIHIWCAFVYAYVYDGTVIHFTRIGESSSSNRLVIDAASFALSRLVIPPLRLYLLFQVYIRVRGVLASLVIRNRRYIDCDGSPNTVIHRYSTLYILVILSAPYFRTSRIDAWNEILQQYFFRWIFLMKN